MKINSARHIWMILINDMQILTQDQEKQGLPGRKIRSEMKQLLPWASSQATEA